MDGWNVVVRASVIKSSMGFQPLGSNLCQQARWLFYSVRTEPFLSAFLESRNRFNSIYSGLSSSSPIHFRWGPEKGKSSISLGCTHSRSEPSLKPPIFEGSILKNRSVIRYIVIERFLSKTGALRPALIPSCWQVGISWSPFIRLAESGILCTRIP